MTRQENAQHGAGQLPYLSARNARREACPVRLVSGWLWCRSWAKTLRDQLGRLSGDDPTPRGDRPPDALRVGLARAKSGLGMASAGISAAWKKLPGVLYAANGVTREAIRELGEGTTSGGVEGGPTTRLSWGRSRLECAATWTVRVQC